MINREIIRLKVVQITYAYYQNGGKNIDTAVNKQLLDFRENQKKSWVNEEDFVRSLYKQIIETDYYKEYMASAESSYAQDRELWRKIYKNVICNNEELDSLLEDMSLYWNDDKYIVDTFVLKIRNFYRNSRMKRIGNSPIVCSVTRC